MCLSWFLEIGDPKSSKTGHVYIIWCYSNFEIYPDTKKSSLNDSGVVFVPVFHLIAGGGVW